MIENRISDAQLDELDVDIERLDYSDRSRISAHRLRSVVDDLRDARHLLTIIREIVDNHALANKSKVATEGPWHVGRGRSQGPGEVEVLDKNKHTEIATCWPETQRENAEMIAGSVNAVRDLLTVLE